MIQSPRFPHKGLSIVLSQPSRFDHNAHELLTGGGGNYFKDFCLRPEASVYQCEVRDSSESAPFPETTTALLLLGEKAKQVFLPSDAHDLTLGQARGNLFHHTCPHTGRVIPAICSFTPQDACDMQDYESIHNPLLNGATYYDEEKDKEDIASEKSRKGITARKNYRFWLKNDTRKAVRIALAGGQIPRVYEGPAPRICCDFPLDEAINALLSADKSNIFLDVETTAAMDIRCLSFGISRPESLPQVIYGITLIDHNWQLKHFDIPRLFWALGVAAKNNTIVTHNGARFDLPLLLYKYRVRLGRHNYDTLVAQHRCFPLVEKSLGHCISYWLYERYHKDDGVWEPKNYDQSVKLVTYCCQDVWTTALVWWAQKAYIQERPGLKSSIELGNRCISKYLLMSLTAMRIKVDKMKAIINENDRLMTQYCRIITHLVGHDMAPTSPPQMVNYFHKELQYPVISWTDSRNPSLSRGNVYKLAMKHNNPVLNFAVKTRELSTESGRLSNFIVTKEGGE